MNAIAMAGVVLLAGGATGYAGQKDTLPNGRPFQILQQQIADLDAALAQQIADLEAQLAALEGRVDAIEQHDAVQDQLIGAVQAAIAMLEQRMAAAEADINALETWNAMQDAVLTQLNNRVNSLQAQVNAQAAQLGAQGASINTLFVLHNQQQILIGQLQSAINFLASQTNAQHNQQQSQINSLQAQLNAVNAAYNITRNQLAAGCAPGSSIRQLIPNGPVLCELDTGQFFQTTQASAFSGSFPPGAIVSATAVCPPVGPPPPGQLPAPQFVATGGGYSLPPVGAQVLVSLAASPNSWRVTVRNTNLPPFGSSISFTALAHCYRNVP